jgi:hypothetical protein
LKNFLYVLIKVLLLKSKYQRVPCLEEASSSKFQKTAASICQVRHNQTLNISIEMPSYAVEVNRMVPFQREVHHSKVVLRFRQSEFLAMFQAKVYGNLQERVLRWMSAGPQAIQLRIRFGCFLKDGIHELWKPHDSQVDSTDAARIAQERLIPRTNMIVEKLDSLRTRAHDDCLTKQTNV